MIEPGKLADLVVLAGNPLDDLRITNTVEQVMLNGRLYDGDTLDEVYPPRAPAAGAVVVGRGAGRRSRLGPARRRQLLDMVQARM